ncbi:hypothetical protein ACJIZ3_014730 [Penstemon smallii]|uniref:Ureide permease n=1 Tax=Penstemon smallii TaxID=265156 RepID=A0ABD3RKF2_9LAMI
MLLGLVFLGTWPAILAHLERRGRLPQHTYLDHSLTNLLTAVIVALTVGQIGDAKFGLPNFIPQLSELQENWPSIMFAMAGGVFLSLGNFRADILFPGVGCFFIAVFMGSAVHSSNAADNVAKMESLSNNCIEGTGILKMYIMKDKTSVGSAEYLVKVENNRATKVFGKSIWLGLSVTFFDGVCYSLFSPALNLATNDQFDMLRRGVPHLVVYTAFFYFSLSFFYHLPKPSMKSYLNDWNGRNWALLGGVMCELGNGLQFMGGQAEGYAAADCVQALPLVSTFWGILCFGEYQRSSRWTYVLLVSMLLMFIVAIGVLMASSGHRKSN